MAEWAGIAVALSDAEKGALNSRLSVYLHPVAGRPLCWHSLHGLASMRPPPAVLVLLTSTALPEELFRDIHPQPVVLPPGDPRVEALISEAGPHVLIADAAAPEVAGSAQPLLTARSAGVLKGSAGALAALLAVPDARDLLREAGPGRQWSDGLPSSLPEVEIAGVGLVRDRAGLSRATALIRDRIVAALMAGGVTVLLPQTVLVDVDVRVGRDSVIYPGVVLEGQTTIGEETVIGPGTRIVDSWIGSGVEMKGWNYISHSSIRNRAILEPYVRRGFD